MLLNMWHIADALASFDTVVDIRDGTTRLSGLRFIASTPDAIYDSRYAYLYTQEDLGEDKETVFISNGPDIVEVSGASANDLLNCIFDVFDRYNLWETELWKIASGGSLQAVIDKGQQMLRNPIMLADSDGHVLAMTSAHRDLDLNEYWIESRETGLIPTAVLGTPRFTEMGQPIRWSHKPNMLLFEDGTKTIGATMNVGGKRAGGIALWEHDTPILRSHIEDMSVLCQVIESMSALGISTKPVVAIGGILHDLLDGSAIDERLLSELNLGFDPPWTIIAVWAPAQESVQYAHNLVERFKQAIYPCIPFVYRDTVCVVAPEATGWKTIEFVLGQQGLETYCSITSLPFDDLTHISNQFTLMRFIRERCTLATAHVRASDFTLSYLDHKMRDALPVQDYAHPALEKLAQYDKKTGGDLYNTLRVYLLNERSLAHSAQELGLHRNSLAARINKIVELTDLDLDDSLERMYLLMSYRFKP